MSSGAAAAAPGPERDTGRSTADATDAAAAGAITPPPDSAPPPAGSPPASPAPSASTHAQFLITSDERDAAEGRLRRAVADEVLSLEEFGDRMRLVLAAQTRGDLHEAVADLPAQRERPSRTAQRGTAKPARRGGSAVAVMGSSEVRGRWRPDDSTRAIAVMGDAVIDLQGVEFEGDELVISAIAVMGDVVIIVPEGVAVDMHGISLMGERAVKVDGTVLPGAPVVRIDGLAVMGQVTVRHPKPKERYASDDGRGAFSDRVPLLAADPAAMQRERVESRRSAARRWGAGLLAAAALALPVGWTLAADDVAGAVFGSAQQTISAAELEAAGEISVGTPVAFGSVEIQVPEGVNVERDGVVIFGSTSCEPACVAGAADAPTVQIRTFGGFGSVEVTQIPGSGTN